MSRGKRTSPLSSHLPRQINPKMVGAVDGRIKYDLIDNAKITALTNDVLNIARQCNFDIATNIRDVSASDQFEAYYFSPKGLMFVTANGRSHGNQEEFIERVSSLEEISAVQIKLDSSPLQLAKLLIAKVPFGLICESMNATNRSLDLDAKIEAYLNSLDKNAYALLRNQVESLKISEFNDYTALLKVYVGEEQSRQRNLQYKNSQMQQAVATVAQMQVPPANPAQTTQSSIGSVRP